MDTYFKFKVYSEYVIPAIIIGIVLAIWIIKGIANLIRDIRVERFFRKHGYERKLFDVASFGNGEFYGWVRDSDGQSVDDRHIRGWSLKAIKKKYS